MSRQVSMDIGINGAFLTRRWEKPDSWMRLTRECGFARHSFCADVLDPFFSGDRTFVTEEARAVKTAAARYGVKIVDVYTGVATHRFHGLSHSDPRARRRMAEWIEACADMAILMGVDAVGGHWDAFSSEVLADPQLTREALGRLHDSFRNLATTFRRKGMRALYQEQMYIPSEKPWLMSEADEFLVAVNKDAVGAPVYLTLDTGHMAGSRFGASGDDLRYEAWIERFASVSEVIHVQQTTRDASHHWPFLPEYNSQGVVNIETVLARIRRSHEHHHERPFAFMTPVKSHTLVLEMIPGSTKSDQQVLNEVRASAQYLRQFVPDGGITFEVAESRV